jgi:Predicted membrane protein
MTAPSSRIPAMDVLRGCAVMGILWMNIAAFALPEQAYFSPSAAGPLSMGDKIFWAVSFLLVDGKMRALFSMLFGASMLLLIDKEEMAGRDGRRAQMIRSAWLFLFGLAHYLLLWWGDILMVYAIVGIAAMLFVRKEPLQLVKWAFLFFLLHFLVSAAFIASLYAWGHAAAAPGAAPNISAGFHNFIASLSDPSHPAVVQEIATYRGGYAGILRHHIALFGGQWPTTLPFVTLDTLGFMLLGMAMLKGGFLTGRWQAEQYWRTARHCFLIGLIPMAGLAAWVMLSGFATLPALGTILTWSFPFRIPLAVGWAALILWAFTRWRDRAIAARIATVGRMALSNYLGTSLIMTAIFYGWGLGLFGRIPHAALPLFVIGGWATMLFWSPLWQKRFAIGPAEWLWRTLARGQAQKIRNSD